MCAVFTTRITRSKLKSFEQLCTQDVNFDFLELGIRPVSERKGCKVQNTKCIGDCTVSCVCVGVCVCVCVCVWVCRCVGLSVRVCVFHQAFGLKRRRYARLLYIIVPVCIHVLVKHRPSVTLLHELCALSDRHLTMRAFENVSFAPIFRRRELRRKTGKSLDRERRKGAKISPQSALPRGHYTAKKTPKKILLEASTP